MFLSFYVMNSFYLFVLSFFGVYFLVAQHCCNSMLKLLGLGLGESIYVVWQEGTLLKSRHDVD